ncbi:MAG: hypothetical protein KAS32_05070 [Candidatus Peribacteraceae bacterium]|nr:hypothetical protein [Candidatus Peribacteraceae bacterium]
MKVYEITKDGSEPLVLDNLQEWNDILGGIEYEETGDTYTITIAEMTTEKYKELPEWGGF